MWYLGPGCFLFGYRDIFISWNVTVTAQWVPAVVLLLKGKLVCASASFKSTRHEPPQFDITSKQDETTNWFTLFSKVFLFCGKSFWCRIWQLLWWIVRCKLNLPLGARVWQNSQNWVWQNFAGLGGDGDGPGDVRRQGGVGWKAIRFTRNLDSIARPEGQNQIYRDDRALVSGQFQDQKLKSKSNDAKCIAGAFVTCFWHVDSGNFPHFNMPGPGWKRWQCGWKWQWWSRWSRWRWPWRLATNVANVSCVTRSNHRQRNSNWCRAFAAVSEPLFGDIETKYYQLLIKRVWAKMTSNIMRYVTQQFPGFDFPNFRMPQMSPKRRFQVQIPPCWASHRHQHRLLVVNVAASIDRIFKSQLAIVLNILMWNASRHFRRYQKWRRKLRKLRKLRKRKNLASTLQSWNRRLTFQLRTVTSLNGHLHITWVVVWRKPNSQVSRVSRLWRPKCECDLHLILDAPRIRKSWLSPFAYRRVQIVQTLRAMRADQTNEPLVDQSCPVEDFRHEKSPGSFAFPVPFWCLETMGSCPTLISVWYSNWTSESDIEWFSGPV